MTKLARTMISTLTPSSKRVRVQRSTACDALPARRQCCCAVLCSLCGPTVVWSIKQRTTEMRYEQED